MKKLGTFLLIASVLSASLLVSEAQAVRRHADRVAARHASGMSWHGPYYNTDYGVPVALVVPPTAHMQTRWGWGVSQGTMTPIYHQFRRPYPGAMEFGGSEMYPTPSHPSHTDQFGVYYIRGPW